LIVGKPSGRPVGSVMADDEVSARQKALDFYQIEPTLFRVVAINSANSKPRDHLVTFWRRPPKIIRATPANKRERVRQLI
jgi:hypothetical protein